MRIPGFSAAALTTSCGESSVTFDAAYRGNACRIRLKMEAALFR